MPLDFKVEAIILKREIYTLINNRRYLYLIDAGLLPHFKSLYSYSPGKALNFLKKNCLETLSLVKEEENEGL